MIALRRLRRGQWRASIIELSTYHWDIWVTYIIYPCATFHFDKKFCISKFLLIKFCRNWKISPILLNKNFKIQKKLYKRKVLEGSIMQVAKIFQQYVEKQSHKRIYRLSLTCGVIDLRSSDVLRRETKYVNA